MKRVKFSHKLAAGIFAGAALTPSSAWAVAATSDFSETTDQITTSASKIPNLITTVAFVAGLAMAVAGIFKLKAHVDNPAQAPLKDALIRFAIGGALLAFPLLLNLMVGMLDDGTGGTGYGAEHTTIGPITY